MVVAVVEVESNSCSSNSNSRRPQRPSPPPLEPLQPIVRPKFPRPYESPKSKRKVFFFCPGPYCIIFALFSITGKGFPIRSFLTVMGAAA